MEQKNNLKVVNNFIQGKKDNNNLYLIVWERLANYGLIYCYAKNEEEAYNLYSFKENPFVKHTIIKLDKNSVPLTDNKKAN